jgi:hypothetical protein
VEDLRLGEADREMRDGSATSWWIASTRAERRTRAPSWFPNRGSEYWP